MSWFSKTTYFHYEDLNDHMKELVQLKIDKIIEYLYQSSHSRHSFQINAANSILLTRDTYVKNIPPETYLDSVPRVLNIPYIIYPQNNEYYMVCIVQNPSPPKLSERLARAAVYQAQDANEICAISLEPLRSLSRFAVSPCGHVFSDEAARLDKCPLCKAPAIWTVITPAPSIAALRIAISP